MAVKSAERVLDLFEHLRDCPDGLTAKELSKQLGWAGSSTFELLKTLSEREYLVMDANRRYTLGPKLINLGMSAAAMLDINKIAMPYLRKTMDILGETVFLAVLSGEEIVYVAKVNSSKTITTNASVGSRKPIYCTGLGKAFLAFMDETQSELIMDRLNYEPFTVNTVRSKKELAAQLFEFRNQGYTIDNGEIEEGLWCVAAPIFDADCRMIAAMSVSGPKVRMLPKKDLIVKTVLEVSHSISHRCGYPLSV